MIRCGGKIRLHPESSHLPLWAATAVAAGMLIAAGLGYRVLAMHLARPSRSAPLPAGALGVLPMELGRWSGRDTPLDDAIVRATATDAHISRTYVRDGLAVGLFVAYGVQTRDLTPHRPEVCYPGAGWTLQARRPAQVETADGAAMEGTLYRFTRGQMDRETTTILNYYIVDGRPCPDVGGVRARVWRGSGGVRYLAQVQIICTGDAVTDTGAAEAAVMSFARQAAGPIGDLFPEVGRPPGQ